MLIRKDQLRPILYLSILGIIITGVFLIRITVLEDKPRYFLFPSYLSRILSLAILSFALVSIDNKIIRLFAYERALNFLLGSMIQLSIWVYPSTAYSVSTLSNLLMTFAMLWFFAAIAFESSKRSVLVLMPFIILFIFFFDSFTNQKGASLYWNAFFGFGLKTGLVLLSYIAYKYIVKNYAMDLDVVLLITGWLAFFATSHLSAVDLGPFNLLRFYSLVYVRSFIYVFWLVILIKRWWFETRHGTLV